MKARRWFWILASLLTVGWMIYGAAGAAIAEKLGTRFGPALLQLGRNKFNDPVWFLQNRFREALWLATLTLAWVAAQALLARPIRAWIRTVLWRWTLHALAGFVFLNLWIAFAMTTAVFWSVLGAGAGWEDYMRFQFKRIIAAELKAPKRAVLVGSSQTEAQIDENLLNQKLGSRLWSTELHFPSSSAYDLLLIEPQLETIRPDLVICYFSENYLYAGVSSDVPKNFLSFTQFAEARRDGGVDLMSFEQVGYGLFGQMVPVFRCRGVLSQRLLGAAMIKLPQTRFEAGLDADLEIRAEKAAPGFLRDSSVSSVQKQALERFVSRCEAANRRVILLIGDYNPILSRKLNPGLRPDMLGFLEELKARHPFLTLVSPAELPPQSAADYEDLFHVNKEAQRRFTEFLVEYLQGQLK